MYTLTCSKTNFENKIHLNKKCIPQTVTRQICLILSISEFYGHYLGCHYTTTYLFHTVAGVIEWIDEVHVGTGRYDETSTYLFHTVAKTHHVD